MAYSQAKQQASSLWLEEVVQDLIQDQELVRIKKLLIYTCTQKWESNPEQIHAADLQNLLQMLVALAPTLEKLQGMLHSVASSLNKAAEYTLIANAILDPIKKRYPAVAQVNGIDIEPTEYQLTKYQPIAKILEQDPEAIRILKLLFLACKNVWISDRLQLAQIDLAELVQELHGLAPSVDELRSLLAKRIQKLSKSTAYGLILEKIVQALQPLYAIDASEELSSSDLEATEFLSNFVSTSSEQVEEELEEKPEENLKEKSVSPMRSNPFKKVNQTRLDLAELFDLRLEIIQYANPFRAKILLFSLLHEPFNQTTEHHLMLKKYDLDEFLRTLLKTYRSFQELEVNFSAVVRQLDEPEEYRRVAEVILQASQIFYEQMPIVSKMSVPSESATNLVKTTGSNGEKTGPDSSSTNKLA